MISLDKPTQKFISVSKDIKYLIRNRIYLVLLLNFIVCIITISFSMYSVISETKEKIIIDCDGLSDYLMGQVLVDNNEAVYKKISAFNSIHPYSVAWYKDNVPDWHIKLYFNSFKMYYPIQSKINSLRQRNFGYFIVEGRFSWSKIFDNLIIKVLILNIMFSLFIYLLLLPLAHSIPKKLIVEPLERILSLVEQNNSTQNVSVISEKYQEFQLIHQRIVNLVNQVNRDSSELATSNLIKRVIHDVKSPLSILNISISKITINKEINKNVINSIENSINLINHTFTSLINIENKSYSSSSTLTYILVKYLLDDLYFSKLIEWRNSRNFIYENRLTKNDSWILSIPYDFMNKISNLLNNAYEATKENALIKLKLFDNNEYIKIQIIDNGHGMNNQQLIDACSGISSKKNGQGVGLSSSIKYFKQVGGKLNINSCSNKGTTVHIEIPKAFPPCWFSENIKLKNTIIIIDDDTSVHQKLQEFLYNKELIIYHFTSIKEFEIWGLNNNALLANSTFLVDNHIGTNTFGKDLINKYRIHDNSYLMTNNYIDCALQKEVAENQITMIPKHLIYDKTIIFMNNY